MGACHRYAVKDQQYMGPKDGPDIAAGSVGVVSASNGSSVRVQGMSPDCDFIVFKASANMGSIDLLVRGSEIRAVRGTTSLCAVSPASR